MIHLSAWAGLAESTAEPLDEDHAGPSKRLLDIQHGAEKMQRKVSSSRSSHSVKYRGGQGPLEPGASRTRGL